MFAAFITKLKVILKNPIVLLVYGIISKWYIMVVITSVMVTYWVFSGLTEAGVMDAAEKVVSKAFLETKSVAQHCTRKILRLGEFWECLNNPPTYKSSKDEQKLEDGLNDLLGLKKKTRTQKSRQIHSNYEEEKDPYAEESTNSQ